MVWVLREKIGLTETKFGCGVEMCGACHVLVDDEITQSCTTNLSEVTGKKVVTKEGLPENHSLNSD